MHNLLVGHGMRVFEPVRGLVDCQIIVNLVRLQLIWMEGTERIHSAVAVSID
jgi:hypothetical protein